MDILFRYTTSISNENKLPLFAEVVIVGGGAIGSSVAYHLSQLGCSNIVLFEQGRYSFKIFKCVFLDICELCLKINFLELTFLISAGCGTSWHAAGLCGSYRSSEMHTRMCLYALELYEKLERETGVSTGNIYIIINYLEFFKKFSVFKLGIVFKKQFYSIGPNLGDARMC